MAHPETRLTMIAVISLMVAGVLSNHAEEEKTLADAAVGPRGPVGPDVPLSESEEKQFAKRITVEGRTAAEVQAACERAVKEGIRTVFLPAGEYVFDTEVRVPGGLMVLGQGSKTLVKAKSKDTHLFSPEGDLVRFTRLKLQGVDTTPSENNDTYGISVGGNKNVRIDHCELLGFSYATNFGGEAAAQVDHCVIHHNQRDGLGYGVAIYSGAYVLITDNEFSQNRHSLASNGTLDWSSPPRVGRFVHKPGRKTHWEFIHNRVDSNDESRYELMAVDTHPGMDGSFVVEANLFENLRHAIGIRDGSGILRGNLFRNLRGKSFRPFVGISISYGTHNGVEVEGCMPHDIEVAENTFLSIGNQAFMDGVIQGSAPAGKAAKYVLGKTENITVEGELVPETLKEGTAATPIPWLQEMGEDGVLQVREARPKAVGSGSVAGTVRDDAGKPAPGVAVLVGDRSATTDADGHFAFPEVTEAARFLVAGKPGCELTLLSLHVRPGEQSVVEVRLSPDKTPPAIVNVRTSELTTTSAAIAWETNEPTTGAVELRSEAGGQDDWNTMASGDKPAMSHSVKLADLGSTATYRVRVKSKDGSGNAATSEEFRFGTPPEADPTPPAGWGYYLGAGKALWGRTTQEAHTGKFSAFLKGVAHENACINFALIVGDSNGYSGANAFPASPGATYQYRFWAKGDLKSVSLVLMTWSTDAADAKARQSTGLSSFTPTAEWKETEGEFTMPAEAKKFVLLFQVYCERLAQENLGVLFVDDLEVKLGEASIIRNGGAENE